MTREEAEVTLILMYGSIELSAFKGERDDPGMNDELYEYMVERRMKIFSDIEKLSESTLEIKLIPIDKGSVSRNRECVLL